MTGKGGRRRAEARWSWIRRGAVVLSGLLVASVTLVALAPAATADDVPENCRLEEDRVKWPQDRGYVGAGLGFLLCRHNQDDLECHRSDHTHKIYRYFCTRSPNHEFRECRNDIRHRWWGGVSDDEETGMFGRDWAGYFPLPTGTTREDIPERERWWFQEFEAEDALANDNDFEGGQSCWVAANRPVQESCETINARKEELREVLAPVAEREAETRDHETVTLTAEEQAALDELNDLESSGGIVPDNCWGTYPSNSYQLTWHSEYDSDLLGGNANRMAGWTATVLYGLSKTVIVILLWLIELAFAFDTNQYRTVAATLARDINVNLVHIGRAEFSLFTLAWFALFAYAGFQFLRGRAGRAAGELAMAIVLAGLGVVLVGDFFPSGDGGQFTPTIGRDQPAYEEGGYFDSVGNLINLSGLAMLAIANGDDPNLSADELSRGDVEELIGDTNGRLHHEFIERPYYFINYGTEDFGDQVNVPAGRLEVVHEDVDYTHVSCLDVVRNLQTVPDSGGAWAQRYMERNGCDEMAEWNGDMGAQRLMYVVLITFVAMFVAVCIGLAAVTLLLAKFLVAVVFLALPVALVMALLPGRSRSLAFAWATTLLQLWLVALAMGLMLVLLIMGIDAIHVTTEDTPLLERWLMVAVLAVTLFLLRKRLVAGAQGVAGSLQSHLTGLSGDKGGNGSQLANMDLSGVGQRGARAGLTGKVALMAGGAMALRGGVRTARRVNHWTAGGMYRTGRAELTRRYKAHLGQRWHQKNTEHNRRAGMAQDIVTGARQSREKKVEDELGSAATGRHHERIQDAAAAKVDSDTISDMAIRRPGSTLTTEQRNALTRHGVDARTYLNGDSDQRKALARQAFNNSQQVIKRAGGSEVLTRQAMADGRARVGQWNSSGTTATYNSREATRAQADRRDPKLAGTANPTTAVRDRTAQLRAYGLMSEDEAKAVLWDQA